MKRLDEGISDISRQKFAEMQAEWAEQDKKQKEINKLQIALLHIRAAAEQLCNAKGMTAKQEKKNKRKAKTPTDMNKKEKTPTGIEWADAKKIWNMFNLGRTTLTRLTKIGRIKACSLSEPGMERGKRLYHVESIREYLNKLAEQ